MAWGVFMGFGFEVGFGWEWRVYLPRNAGVVNIGGGCGVGNER